MNWVGSTKGLPESSFDPKSLDSYVHFKHFPICADNKQTTAEQHKC